MTVISTTVDRNPLAWSTKESKMQYLDAVSKTITVIQVYALISNAEEAEVEWFYEDLQDLLELKPKKDVLFIIGD